MPDFLTVDIKDSIATHLMKMVFGLYFLVALTVTLIHMVAEYHNSQQRIMADLERIQTIFKGALEQTLLEVDEAQLQLILEGMMKNPSISGISIHDRLGNKQYAIGMILNDQGKIIRSGPHQQEDSGAPSSLIKLYWNTFPVIMDNNAQRVHLGNIVLFSSSEVVFQEVKNGFVFILINAVIKTAALWIIFLFMARIYLSRPLAQMTAATEKLELEQLEHFIPIHIHTHEKNELKVLEKSFNFMTEKLLIARKKIETAQQNLIEEHEKMLKAEQEKFQAQQEVIEQQEELLLKNRILEEEQKKIESLKNFVHQNTPPVDRDSLYVKSEFPYCIVVSATGKPDRIFRCKLDEVEALDAYQPGDVMKLVRISKSHLVVASKIIEMVRDTERTGNTEYYGILVKQNTKKILLKVSERYNKVVKEMIRRLGKPIEGES